MGEASEPYVFLSRGASSLVQRFNTIRVRSILVKLSPGRDLR